MPTLYDIDFNRWALEQAEALKAGHLPQLDLEHLAEEIEALSKSDKRAIKSDLVRILFHLLKWRYQPEQRSESWANSIADSRLAIRLILEDSPSLKAYPAEVLEDAYRQARRQNPQNPAVDPGQFPASCPWTVEQALREDFWPD